MPSMQDIIGSNPLAQSLSNRGIPLSILAKMSPSAMNFQPDLQQPLPDVPLPNGSPMHNLNMQPLQQPQAAPQNPGGVVPTPGVPQPQVQSRPMVSNAQSPKPMSEAQSIIKVLTEHLGHLDQKEASKPVKAQNGQR